MLTLTGKVRSVVTMPARVDRKTGEVIQPRSLVQVEGLDARGLVQLFTLTVPDASPYEGKVDHEISVPVRAWAAGATVNLVFEGGSR